MINLHGSYAQVVCLTCGYTTSRTALAEQLEALNPGFLRRAEALGGLAVAPDADAVVADTASFRYLDCPTCGGMLKPDIVYFGENVPKSRLERAISLVEDAEALLVAGSSLKVFSGYRFVRHAASLGLPVAIVNRGPTRGDELANVKVDGGCSEIWPCSPTSCSGGPRSPLRHFPGGDRSVGQIAPHAVGERPGGQHRTRCCAVAGESVDEFAQSVEGVVLRRPVQQRAGTLGIE